MELQPIIVSAGLVIGVLIGLTGMGGGALMTPFLILMGVRPSVAVGTDLFQMMFTKSFGAWQHHRQGTVNYRVVLPLIRGSLPGALLGVVLLVVLRDSFGIFMDVFLARLLGGVLTLVGVALLLRLLLRRWFRIGWSHGKGCPWRAWEPSFLRGWVQL
ncbi:MAG: sulfite exporter TauE/SafE family protein [Chloroflexi bacterium]|nr:sulfite exporter TauE/SafE family protein [Chloroflexota bacterium]